LTFGVGFVIGVSVVTGAVGAVVGGVVHAAAPIASASSMPRRTDESLMKLRLLGRADRPVVPDAPGISLQEPCAQNHA
jgi:hypothetical protein